MIEHPRCPFCHDSVKPDDGKYGCHECMAWHHSACWYENGGGICSACGNTWTQQGRGAFSKAIPPVPKAKSRKAEFFGAAWVGVICSRCHRSRTIREGVTECGQCLKRPRAKNSGFLDLVKTVSSLLGRKWAPETEAEREE